jgi:hypothetical protein
MVSEVILRGDSMRKLLNLAGACAVLLYGATLASGQSAMGNNGLPAVPTTKVLAIGHLTAAATPEKMRPVMSSEVPDTVKLYLKGKIDQWYSRQDQRGVVFVMNVATVEEARALLEKLPLGQAKLMEFDLIPLGPLSPLQVLLNGQAGSPAAAK